MEESTQAPSLVSAVKQTVFSGESPKRGWNLYDFLTTFRCRSPLFPNDFGVVVAIPNTSTIGEAFKQMIDHQMLSIPVVHPTTGKPLYVFSMVHMVQFLIKNYPASEFKEDIWHRLKSAFYDNLGEFRNKRLVELDAEMDLTLDAVPTLDEDASLLDAVQAMVRSQAHRVLITNKKGDMTNVITQSRIIQFLATMIDSIPNTDKTLKDLGLGFKNVFCINENSLAYDAFKLMGEQRLSGLAVINNSKVLVGNISLSDLKLTGFKGEFWHLLGKPVHQYSKEVRYHPEAKVRPSVFALLHDEAMGIVVKCRPSHTLGYVMRLLSYYRIHKIYMVDDYGVPIGVVSLTDIMNELLTSAQARR